MKLTGANRASIAEVCCARYAEGNSIRRIAADLSVSYGFVHRLLTESGVTLRSPGFNSARRMQKAQEAQL